MDLGDLGFKLLDNLPIDSALHPNKTVDEIVDDAVKDGNYEEVVYSARRYRRKNAAYKISIYVK
ncbi:MAG: hypothetical protein IPL32_02580 [Chloracidobacterium sp.]|nr:hypothetical protein [Chloracidobacterium sp.]